MYDITNLPEEHHVKKVRGVGKKLTKRLTDLGIKTVGELAEWPPDRLAPKIQLNTERAQRIILSAQAYMKETKEAPIDYYAVPIPEPESKKLNEYTAHERRAEILQLILKAGHPRLLPRNKLAARYGVSGWSITNDIKVLSQYIARSIGDNADSFIETIYQNALMSLLQQGEHYHAVKVLESRTNWMYQRGMLEKVPDKHVMMSLHANMDQPLEAHHKEDILQLLKDEGKA